MELSKREQEFLAMGAKMKTLEEQHHDYQRHIAVLKESLCAKEEHQNMLQADVCPSPFLRLSLYQIAVPCVHLLFPPFLPLYAACLTHKNTNKNEKESSISRGHVTTGTISGCL
jgi:hypothetical protein